MLGITSSSYESPAPQRFETESLDFSTYAFTVSRAEISASIARDSNHAAVIENKGYQEPTGEILAAALLLFAVGNIVTYAAHRAGNSLRRRFGKATDEA